MKEKQKLITVRIDNSDFLLLQQAQENFKITSFNSIMRQLLYGRESVHDFYERSVKFKELTTNKKFK